MTFVMLQSTFFPFRGVSESRELSEGLGGFEILETFSSPRRSDTWLHHLHCNIFYAVHVCWDSFTSDLRPSLGPKRGHRAQKLLTHIAKLSRLHHVRWAVHHRYARTWRTCKLQTNRPRFGSATSPRGVLTTEPPIIPEIFHTHSFSKFRAGGVKAAACGQKVAVEKGRAGPDPAAPLANCGSPDSSRCAFDLRVLRNLRVSRLH